MARGILNEHQIGKDKNIGYVYIGGLTDKKGVYKIGRTKDLNSRLISLKSEYGDKFEFYYFSDLLYNCVEAEVYLHSQWMSENIVTDIFKGEEWFELGDLAVDCIIEDMKRLSKLSKNLFDEERWYLYDN